MDKRFSVRAFGRRWTWTVWVSLQRVGGGRLWTGMARPGFVSCAIILGGWRLALATWARAPRCYTRDAHGERARRLDARRSRLCWRRRVNAARARVGLPPMRRPRRLPPTAALLVLAMLASPAMAAGQVCLEDERLLRLARAHNLERLDVGPAPRTRPPLCTAVLVLTPRVIVTELNYRLVDPTRDCAADFAQHPDYVSSFVARRVQLDRPDYGCRTNDLPINPQVCSRR